MQSAVADDSRIYCFEETEAVHRRERETQCMPGGATDMDDIVDHLEQLATLEVKDGVEGYQWKVRTIKQAVGEIVRLREITKYSQIADRRRKLSGLSWFRRSPARVG